MRACADHATGQSQGVGDTTPTHEQAESDATQMFSLDHVVIVQI